eukprot:GHUV01022891.1.p1 GENE.GHUV01022891.1~~GHUV01022891.1.p1  ORF type:complete len:205 (+),score=46.00 GHUV01022891.1:313-927(+)
MGQALSCVRATAVHEDAACTCKAQAVIVKSTGKAAAQQPVSSSKDAADTTGQQIAQLPAAQLQVVTQQSSLHDRMGRPAQPNLPYEVGESGPPLPPCQEARLQSLHLNALLDTAPKGELQNILKLVCSIFNTNHALIALLFDRRVYITNGTGNFQEGDFPWRYSFCGWTMTSEQHTVMVIHGAEQDARSAAESGSACSHVCCVS